ncbi:hypothetical protein B0H14DRAFT_3127897 [Mycena olivaceomarginata]|nr:hypothetical protein B0H14DRAFT_3127897 [Mycena olivaceomarginata]
MTAGPRQQPRRRSCRAFSAPAPAFCSLPAPYLHLFVGSKKRHSQVSSIPATHFIDAIRFHVSLGRPLRRRHLRSPTGKRQVTVAVGRRDKASIMDAFPHRWHSTRFRHRAMHSEHVPDASKDRQQLDYSFGFARDGILTAFHHYSYLKHVQIWSINLEVPVSLRMSSFCLPSASIQRSAFRKSPDFSLPLLLSIIGSAVSVPTPHVLTDASNQIVSLRSSQLDGFFAILDLADQSPNCKIVRQTASTVLITWSSSISQAFPPSSIISGSERQAVKDGLGTASPWIPFPNSFFLQVSYLSGLATARTWRYYVGVASVTSDNHGI